MVGQCQHDIVEDCNRIRVPVVLHDEPLVVSGCLHHLGVKRATLSVDDQMQFPVKQTQVVSVTAYQDEIDATAWAAIVKSPVRNMMQILSQEAGEVELLSPPWGRSFQRHGKGVMLKLPHQFRSTFGLTVPSFEGFSRCLATPAFIALPKLKTER